MNELTKAFVGFSLAGVLALLVWMAGTIYSSSMIIARLDENVNHLAAGMGQLPNEVDLVKTNGRIDAVEGRVGILEELAAKAFRPL